MWICHLVVDSALEESAAFADLGAVRAYLARTAKDATQRPESTKVFVVADDGSGWPSLAELEPALSVPAAVYR